MYVVGLCGGATSNGLIQLGLDLITHALRGAPGVQHLGSTMRLDLPPSRLDLPLIYLPKARFTVDLHPPMLYMLYNAVCAV